MMKYIINYILQKVIKNIKRFSILLIFFTFNLAFVFPYGPREISNKKPAVNPKKENSCKEAKKKSKNNKQDIISALKEVVKSF